MVKKYFQYFMCQKKSDFVSEETNTPPLFPPPRKVKYCFIFVRKTNGTLFTIMYLLFCSPIIIVRVCHSDWCSFRLYYSEATNLFFLTMQKCSLQYIGPILLIFSTMILPNQLLIFFKYVFLINKFKKKKKTNKYHSFLKQIEKLLKQTNPQG